MFVFIDSNIFVKNYDVFDTIAFQRFSRHFPEKLITVGISQVSIFEIFKNHELDVTREIESFDKQIKNLNKHLVNKLPYSLIKDLPTEIVNYQNYFQNQIDKYDIKVFRTPNISHDEILKYSITQRKPFDSKDNGYKDFLIWVTIVETLKKSTRPVVLISNDSDFSNGKLLHDDLLKHLKDNGIDHTRVTLCKSLSEFNESYLKDVYDLVETKTLFESPKKVREFYDYVQEEINQLSYNENLLEHNINLDPRFNSAYIEDLHFLDDFKILSLDIVGTDSIAISFECYANAIINVTFEESDYHDLYNQIDEVNSDQNPYYEGIIYSTLNISGTFVTRDSVHNIIQKEIQFAV